MALFLALLAAAPAPVITGGWQPIDHPARNPEIRAIARHAAAHLPRPGRLARVLRGEWQVVAGINYHLTLRLTDRRTCAVTVWRHPDGALDLTDAACR